MVHFFVLPVFGRKLRVSVAPKECLCLGAQVPELEGVRAVISLEDLSTTGADDARERVQPGATLAARWARSPRPLP